MRPAPESQVGKRGTSVSSGLWENSFNFLARFLSADLMLFFSLLVFFSHTDFLTYLFFTLYYVFL